MWTKGANKTFSSNGKQICILALRRVRHAWTNEPTAKMCVADLTNKLQTSLLWGIDNSLSLELHTPPLRIVEKERKQSNNVSRQWMKLLWSILTQWSLGYKHPGMKWSITSEGESSSEGLQCSFIISVHHLFLCQTIKWEHIQRPRIHLLSGTIVLPLRGCMTFFFFCKE